MIHPPTQPFWPFWITADFQVRDPWKGGPREGSHIKARAMGLARVVRREMPWLGAGSGRRSRAILELHAVQILAKKERKTCSFAGIHKQQQDKPIHQPPNPQTQSPPPPAPAISCIHPSFQSRAHGHSGLNSFRSLRLSLLACTQRTAPGPASQFLPAFWPLYPPSLSPVQPRPRSKHQRHSTAPPQRHLEEGHRSNTHTHKHTHFLSSGDTPCLVTDSGHSGTKGATMLVSESWTIDLEERLLSYWAHQRPTLPKGENESGGQGRHSRGFGKEQRSWGVPRKNLCPSSHWATPWLRCGNEKRTRRAWVAHSPGACTMLLGWLELGQVCLQG